MAFLLGCRNVNAVLLELWSGLLEEVRSLLPILEHFKVIFEQPHDILENRNNIRTKYYLLEQISSC